MSDIKTTEGYQILMNLINDNSIDSETCDRCLNKLQKFQDYLLKYMELEKAVSKSLNDFKEEITKTLNDNAILSNEQKELNEKILKKGEELRKAKNELSEYETSRALSQQLEIEGRQAIVDKLQQELTTNEEETRLAWEKQINTIIEENKQKEEQVAKLKEEIKAIEIRYKELQDLKGKIDFKNEQKKKEILEAEDNISIRNNEIQNEGKSMEHMNQAEKKLTNEISNQQAQIRDQTTQNTESEARIKKKNDAIQNLQLDLENYKKESDSLFCDFKTYERENKKQDDQIKSQIEKKTANENEKNVMQREYELAKDFHTKIKMQSDKSSRDFVDKQNKLGKEKTTFQEDMNKLEKEKSEMKKLLDEINDVHGRIIDLQEEMREKDDKEKKKEDLKKNCGEKKTELDKNMKDLEDVEKLILKRADKVKENIEDIKNKRESIIRTKERLEEATSLINEEIQIKELIFLDMTKKHEELRHMYQKYHVLYETVLQERNKNVVKIQNANQNRAELKEKLRILTTEMDILDAELTEIYNKIIDKDKDLNKISTDHNKLKQEINTFGLKNLIYKEDITKLTNENEKLHSIINSIENEMVSLRVDYELACESRNYTGIQLIDRNDELCIFYEKIHHIETRINDLYKNILDKEATVQRSGVEVSEIERFIEVNRKKIPMIPELSNNIKELDNELKILNKTLEKLIEYVENPENNLKNELPGEDPDTDYLKMKYDQLSDMLNEKKEQLLEKELINDEINEIAEKLRKKAMEDRGKNLDISEKMNEYEMKLNDITRKNIASTSELSMFQAILTKLQNTKKEKEAVYFESQKRFMNGMPPTEDSEKNFESLQEVDARRREYLDNRRNEVKEKEQIVVGEIPLRKKPEKRAELYEDPKTGLPLAYGKYFPFNFDAEHPPNNLRHLKRMKLKQSKNSDGNGKEKIIEI